MVLDSLNLSNSTVTILSLSIILLSAFLMTRITKKLKFPNVTGYILAGILIGPCVLKIIPHSIINGMEFVADIALAFIAFDVGRYLKLSNFKENGSKVLIITLCESLMAASIVTVTMLSVFKLPLSFSLLLGSIGAATAPASTIMTIRQYKARGNFVNTLFQVVALGDAVALISFSICATIAKAMSSNGELNFKLFLYPIILNLIVIVIGIIFALILNRIINQKRTEDNKLILGISMIILLSGICSAFNISPLLSSMALGTVYINISNNKKLFLQISNFTPPILITFFVLSGMRLNIPSLLTGGIIGLSYFIVRIIGKYIGTYIGSSLVRADDEIRKYLGLALIPQASVSIGLAFLGQRILPNDLGLLLSTIILSSAILYEIVGPILAKVSLYLSGSIPLDNVKEIS